MSAEVSVLALGCGDESFAHPVGEGLTGALGRSGQGGMLGVSSSEAFDVAARVLDGRASGSRAHVPRIAATESVDNRDFGGHNKSMAKNENPQVDDEDMTCSDCFQSLDDPEYHCQQCGDHVDGLGECQSGCDDGDPAPPPDGDGDDWLSEREEPFDAEDSLD